MQCDTLDIQNIAKESKDLGRIPREHPSLQNTHQKSISNYYQNGREDADDETGLTLSTFLKHCSDNLEAKLLNLL